eukprot:Skav216183  [mRNA]  locus=scaffold2249:186423:186843:+ [translate_table: standard]
MAMAFVAKPLVLLWLCLVAPLCAERPSLGFRILSTDDDDEALAAKRTNNSRIDSDLGPESTRTPEGGWRWKRRKPKKLCCLEHYSTNGLE